MGFHKPLNKAGYFLGGMALGGAPLPMTSRPRSEAPARERRPCWVSSSRTTLYTSLLVDTPGVC